MKIAHIVCTYPPYYGGMGNVVFQTAEQLKKRGHDVTVFTPDYGEVRKQLPNDQDIEDTTFEARRLTPSFAYGNAARLPDLAQELKHYDLVHLHYPFFGTASVVRKWKLRNPHIPLVLTYHMDTRSDGWKGLFFQLYARYYMQKVLDIADTILVSSEDYAAVSDAQQHFHAHRSVWQALPFGVDTNRFQPREKPEALFLRHTLDPAKATIVFVGGMDKAHYFKGIEVLLQALYILKKEEKIIQAVFVGGGELRESYEQKAVGLRLSDTVRFVGKASDEELPYYYAMGDLCCLPSTTRGEAFGMVLLEAMACGLPVVASDLPGVRTVAQHGGFVVPPKDAAVLAATLWDFFMLSDAERAALGQQARRNMEQFFAWEAITVQLEQIYRGIVEKP